jgi:hypothetical protein
MTEPKDTWESLGDVTTRLMAKLEEEQRVLFLNLCRQDGIKPKVQTKGESEHARV